MRQDSDLAGQAPPWRSVGGQAGGRNKACAWKSDHGVIGGLRKYPQLNRPRGPVRVWWISVVMHFVGVSARGDRSGCTPWPVRWWRSLTLDQRERRLGVMFMALGVVQAFNGLVFGSGVFRVVQLVCAGVVLVPGVVTLLRHRGR